MNEHIHFVVDYIVNEGMEDEFLQVGEELVKMSLGESGTLAYEWYTSDGIHYHFYERYCNSEAVLAHLRNFAKYADRLAAAGNARIIALYGDASSAVIEELGGQTLMVMNSGIGFNRL